MTEERKPPVMVDGQPNPTGTGRYCAPNRCYCGACPGYADQVAEANRQYQVEVRAAKRALAEKEERRQGWRR